MEAFAQVLVSMSVIETCDKSRKETECESDCVMRRPRGGSRLDLKNSLGYKKLTVIFCYHYKDLEAYTEVIFKIPSLSAGKAQFLFSYKNAKPNLACGQYFNQVNVYFS